MTLFLPVICCFRVLYAFQMNIMKISFVNHLIHRPGEQEVVIEIWRATFVRQKKSICTRSIKISRLPHGFEYIQACANDLSFNKLLKFTLKSVFENFYFACGFILMSNFFVYICTCTYTGASTSFMFKSYRSFLLQAKFNNCEAYCFSIFVFGAIPFVNYYETKTQTEMFQI